MRYHVYQGSSGKWEVHLHGADGVIASFATQKEAVSCAIPLCKENHATLYVHRKDGIIRRESKY